MSSSLEQFKKQVATKFQLYNSLFNSLPFHTIEKTGILNSLLLINCEEGFENELSPLDIIDNFFAKQTNCTTDKEKADLLFKLVQYIERQVVLFDALEDAGFAKVNDLNGKGSLRHLEMEISTKQKANEFKEKIKDFNLQLVLTAHPTQFYRGAVLGIINDLSNAIQRNNESNIYSYLEQLGRTAFFQKQKPTPFDEAVSLIWYLESVFYPAIGKINTYLKNTFGNQLNPNNPIIKMGFWPGGDRDGNPFVNANTTLQVAKALRSSALKCYYLDVRKLKRRLTFKGVDVALAELEKDLYNNVFIPNFSSDISKDYIIKCLQNIRYELIKQHNGLFANQVENLINKVEIFGTHFASLDIRQDSTIHTQTLYAIAQQNKILPQNYSSLSDDEKINLLTNINTTITDFVTNNEVLTDTLQAIQAIKNIQQTNGQAGCNRYIISQCNSAVNMFEVFGLFLLSGFTKQHLTVDIIPLFETIDDLTNAATIMQKLYTNPIYMQHLQNRNNKQTIMLGFSDGTKDGGYLMANWSIYKAKEQLTTISKQYNIHVVFFDGRGGPPARGGGKTHNFYASLGKNISSKEIQLTIQGQTVSSNFGTVDAAQFNIEQLLHAGISNNIFDSTDNAGLTQQQQALMQTLAQDGLIAYKQLKEHPYFTDYLLHASPLKFYSDTNIASRPTKRGKTDKLTLADLRAIPFVGAWSQLKQNVTGFYGVGYALENAANNGQWQQVKDLYTSSLFFRTLIDNCEMAMKKCFFPLTSFLAKHPKYGQLWQLTFDEFNRTKNYVLLLTNHQNLMANYPVDQLSINMRERIVLPLLTIQQYAITKVKDLENTTASTEKSCYEKLVMRCSFGIINAGRNSA